MSHTFFKQCHCVTTFKQVCQFISVQHCLFYYNNFLEKIIILKVVTLFILTYVKNVKKRKRTRKKNERIIMTGFANFIDG